MTRRDVLAIPALAGVASAQSRFPGTPYRDYSHVLPDYLRRLAQQAYERRRREIVKLTSRDAVHSRQKWVRETFWKLVGGMPERTPLNARVVSQFERPAYRVEKLVYESRPGLHIPANLYIPKSGSPPYPAVLFQMGHSLNGKAADPYQRCCQGLAQLGFLVLAFDPMGQGERVYYPNPALTRTRLASADDEHTTPGRQMLLLGDTATRLQTWDAVRSLDYLAAHPLADPKRLGSTGQSGGGTLTMLLIAADDRLAAAVVCSGNTENLACRDFNPPGSTDDAEQNFLDGGAVGFDRWDLLYPFAPKPLLISVSDKDFFGTYSPQYLSSGWEEFQHLQRAYKAVGAEANLAWTGTPLPHALAYDSRLQVYNWFLRHLKGDAAGIQEEPPVQPEQDRTLWVSDSGNVVQSFGGLTPFQMVHRLAADIRPDGRLPDNPAPGNRAPAILRRVPSRGVSIEALDIESEPGVHLPAWLFAGSSPERILLLLHPTGRNINWHEGELYQELGKRYAVCAADVRGTGDLVAEFGRGAPRYTRSHQDEENYAWASMMLGRPLLYQRAADIAALGGALRLHPALKGLKLRIAAAGKLAVPALLAASSADEVYLSGGLASWRSIVETENYEHPLANFAPRLLAHTDLPLLAQAAAPRPVCLAGAVDARGRALDTTEVRKLYPWPHVTVRARSQWDESLAGPLA